MARSVILIGSSGGGTATLGHTDAVDLITTIHLELLKLRGEAAEHHCSGISHAIFVSLCDGSGFDCIQEDRWVPSEEVRHGPLASLYTVGFGSSTEHFQGQFQVQNVCTGPLTYINHLAKNLDDQLARIIREDTGNISAILSISSESKIIHASSLKACSELNLPVAGSGGTSLSNIASAFDLRIIGNSGGSVASTTVTKAKGWAKGLSNEWGVAYDVSYEPEGFAKSSPSQSDSQPIPSLKSILEAALPSFLVICIALRTMDWFGEVAEECSSIDRFRGDEDAIRFVFRCIMPTICCILAATSRNTDRNSDQSTLIQTSTLAGILASASAFHGLGNSSSGGGSVAGLVAGSTVPKSLEYASSLCRRYNVTATMTNCILGGGVGIAIGLAMHISGLSSALSLLTGMIRQTIRFEILTVPEIMVTGIENLLPYLVVKVAGPVMSSLQNLCANVASLGVLSSTFFDAQGRCSKTFLPIPIGLGFFSGCGFVYGSKVGWYHSAFLPLILLEMDSSGEASLLGAMDQCTLVMVCAGICSANLLSRPRKAQDKTGDGQASLARQALKTNLFCGDFIVSG